MNPVSVSERAYHLWALLLGAFCLRVAFAFLTPAWQSADEYPHYWVASSIALDSQYPAGSPDFPRYEAYQSPLYYYLLAGVIHQAGLTALAYSEIPQSPSPSLVVLRLISVLLGVSVVAATWSATKALSPANPDISYFASAFVAVLPTFVGLSASLNNDVLAVFFSSLFLAAVLRPLPQWSRGSCLGAGFLLGAAIASKLTGALLIPVLACRLMGARREEGGSGLLIRTWFLRFVPGIVTGVLVLAARNVAVYGDPIVITPGVESGLGLTGLHLLRAVRNMGWSFLLAFGRTYEIHLSPPAYVLAGGALLATASAGWWMRRKAPAVRSTALLIAVAAGMGVVASLVFTLSYPAGTQTSWGKNLFPLLPLVAASAAFGWVTVFPRYPRIVPWLAIAVLFAGSVWGLTQLASR